jgi:hypothetical protein
VQSRIKLRAVGTDEAHMTIALPSVSRDVKSFRLAQPAVNPTSTVDLPLCGALALAAAGTWLFVLPIELLRLLPG